jgi:hypothetical protein
MSQDLSRARVVRNRSKLSPAVQCVLSTPNNLLYPRVNTDGKCANPADEVHLEN